MRSIPVLAVLFTLLCMTTTGQTGSRQMLVPGGEYLKISGKSAILQGRYDTLAPFTVSDRPAIKETPGERVPAVFLERKKSALKSQSTADPEKEFFGFMEKVRLESGIKEPRTSFRITRVNTDRLGITHVRTLQLHKGIEIYGSESVYHSDNQKERFTGSFHSVPDDVESEPKIDRPAALETVISDLKKNSGYRDLTDLEKKFLNYESPSSSLVLFNRGKGSWSLAWVITIRPDFVNEWKYFVDAGNGVILRKYNNTKYDGPAIGTGTDLNQMIRNFNVYLSGGIYYMYDISQRMFNSSTNEGIIITLDGNSTSTLNLDYTYVTSADNSWSQQAAISAHCNATRTYQYFDTTFNRNSINGKGGNIISLVNIVNDDGSPMENAFWNGQAVFYGNGGSNFRPVAAALDVTAHELSHGVISSTANLDYYGQPGAINESFADIFACMIDRNDWTIGEDITKESYAPSGVIRDLSNPHNKGTSTDRFWQPVHTTEMFLGTEDNAGIHLNSGICNYAYYLYAARIGKDKAEQVYYRALTEYLTQNSGFTDLRIAVVQSARDLYGEGSEEMREAGSAFETVGIYSEEFVDKTPLYESNPGEEMLLSYDTNPNDPVSLYLSSWQGTNYRPLSNTPMMGKVSVTDDGTIGVFVSSERRIRMINTDSSNVNERVISGYNYYDNVAISKDGKRLAATKGFSDASIYVIDLVSGEGRQFILYNPTTNPAKIDAGGVLKAYSIEFDITGEYLIYDAYNVINSNSTKDIHYWDIGFIRVWDNINQDFGDGRITKLYSALPAHVNVANPVFSKNSPHIIAYDYFYDDGIIENYSVYAANLHTGEIRQISVNDRLGYPTFSTHDDFIAFSTINSSNMQVIKSVRLSDDKITPVGEAGVLVPDAKWPVYFTRGSRSLGLAPVSDFTVDFKYGNFPVSARFFDLSANNPVAWHWEFEGGNPTESDEQNPSVTFDLPGFYRVSLTTTNSFGTNTLVRDRYIHAINPVSADEHTTINPEIYPNPVTSILNVVAEGDFSISVYNLQGERICFAANQNQIDLGELNNGMYVIEIRTGDSTYRRKFVKE